MTDTLNEKRKLAYLTMLKDFLTANVPWETWKRQYDYMSLYRLILAPKDVRKMTQTMDEYVNEWFAVVYEIQDWICEATYEQFIEKAEMSKESDAKLICPHGEWHIIKTGDFDRRMAVFAKPMGCDCPCPTQQGRITFESHEQFIEKD